MGGDRGQDVLPGVPTPLDERRFGLHCRSRCPCFPSVCASQDLSTKTLTARPGPPIPDSQLETLINNLSALGIWDSDPANNSPTGRMPVLGRV